MILLLLSRPWISFQELVLFNDSLLGIFLVC